jgi:hypothetical protein
MEGGQAESIRCVGNWPETVYISGSGQVMDKPILHLPGQMMVETSD